MIRLKDIRKDPVPIIGGILAFTCFLLILILFLFDLFVGGMGAISGYFLFYIIPLLLITSVLLLTISKFKEIVSRRRGRKIKRIRKTRNL